jgi:transposase
MIRNGALSFVTKYNGLPGSLSLWPAYERLQALRGIGKILGLTIALKIGDVKRCADAGNFASYCLCVESLRQRNGKEKGEDNRKSGNPYLAWAFVQAAHTACRYDDQCRRYLSSPPRQEGPL